MNLTKHIAALAAIGLIQGCTFMKTVVHNGADLDDHRIFANRAIEPAREPSVLRTLPSVPRFVADMKVPDETGATRPLDRYLDDTRTAAFVVMRDDRIVYERYARGFDPHSLLNSFSIAKSIVATLVGIAHAEGRIPSLEATVADYRPDFSGTPYGAVTLKALLTMTSGMGDAPSMLPGRAQHYYGDDLHGVVGRSQPENRAANGWRYSEGDAQMLGFVLEAAVGKTVSAYLAEKLWTPLGMESEALWALDREGGVEKSFCCISAPPATSRASAGSTSRAVASTERKSCPRNGPRAQFSGTDRQDPVPVLRAVAGSLKSPEHIAELDRLESQVVALR